MNSRMLLATLVLIALSLYLPRVKGNNGYVGISVSEAKNMIDSNPLLVVLDVRNQSEYNSGHIRNAKLIPVEELEARISELDENRETLVYCRSGVKSATASQILTAHGFNEVYNMIGGIMDWIGMDYPVYVRYSSIQEAINNGNDGETIFISSGLYREHLVVDKSLTLVGENRDTTIIDGGDLGTVVHMKDDNTLFTDFTIQGSGCGCAGRSGILLEESYNSTITGNIVKNGGGFGIHLRNSSSCTVTNNKITNNTDVGIYSYYLDSSIISGNIVINNSQPGIRLYWTNSCNLAYNNVVNNSLGVRLLESNDNNFYLNNFINNFINNTKQAALMESFSNSWDNGPSGGNYWCDYNGTDVYSGPYQNKTGSDGIGDDHYIISKENQDDYPLMGPVSHFRFTWEEQNYHIDVISNATVSDFDFGVIYDSELRPGVSFNVTSSNGTLGFCRIVIPKALINEPYIVLVNGEESNTTLLDIPSTTHAYLYFTYNLSTKHVVIIPEFSSALILSLFTIVILTIVVLMKHKYPKEKKHSNII